jgi:hypothetical protein
MQAVEHNTKRGEYKGITAKEIITPPRRLPSDSQTYTFPIAAEPASFSAVLHARGNIKPTIKLKGATVVPVPRSIFPNEIYSPGGIIRMLLRLLMRGIKMTGAIERKNIAVMKARRGCVSVLQNLPETHAPQAIPKNQEEKIIPRHSSLPKNSTSSSRIKNIWAAMEWAPISTRIEGKMKDLTQIKLHEVSFL